MQQDLESEEREMRFMVKTVLARHGGEYCNVYVSQ